jgi:hypothetical protein
VQLQLPRRGIRSGLLTLQRDSVCCRATRGALHWMGGVVTLGLLFLTPFLKDTAHHCPKCGRNVAVAKLM